MCFPAKTSITFKNSCIMANSGKNLLLHLLKFDLYVQVKPVVVGTRSIFGKA